MITDTFFDNVKWICDEGCNVEFPNADAAINHFATVHPEGRKGIPCPHGCGWQGPLGHIKVHIKREHGKRKRASR